MIPANIFRLYGQKELHMFWWHLTPNIPYKPNVFYINLITLDSPVQFLFFLAPWA